MYDKLLSQQSTINTPNLCAKMARLISTAIATLEDI